ncbi:uncharacterized protein snsl [Venturia canescens]|uniref:uncharacterized protein snsl n=1 Tax=Venturia canescens TaxID=32260 RepID=UPI001C9C4814|nr:uncharacterized protein LOC122414141 [Venturia canescens]XP_043281000.1 uncharacterized protein LOC122414141 [Venturia canescens]
MNTNFIRISILLLFYDCVTALIIPEELPTILSLIYSNIPPIKKGTDSRVGVGFRLGEHADFQILVELGPQKETEAIGNAESKRRRMATYGAAMRGELGPWAQSVAKYQTQMRIQNELAKMKQLEDKLAKIKLVNGEKLDHKKVSSNDWLQKWSKGLDPVGEKDLLMRSPPMETIPLNVKNDKRIDRPTDLNGKGNTNDKVADLQKLFKQQPTS